MLGSWPYELIKIAKDLGQENLSGPLECEASNAIFSFDEQETGCSVHNCTVYAFLRYVCSFWWEPQFYQRMGGAGF